MRTKRRRARLRAGLIVLSLAAATMSTAAAVPAMATVTCPVVDLSGTVTPAPSPGVDWANCDLTGASMPGADLAGANLQGANLTRVSATNADLTNADLSGATLTSALLGGNLSGANLSTAYVFGLTIGGDLQSANLESLAGGSIDLTGVSLRNADLTGADLDNSQLVSDSFLGATLTGATDVSAFWSNDICPSGASSAYYTDGCLSAVAVTTPAATPVVTAGTVGNNGWYSSAVTVTWYWIDRNSLVSGECPASTTVSAQGIAVPISASCIDSAANVGHASVTEKIDTTPPVVALTGVTKGAIYPYGPARLAQCLTTDSYSGVAAHAGSQTIGGRPDGTGVLTAECTGATDRAGNQAPTVTVTYQVVYAFGGFMSPAVGSTLNPSARTIGVRFMLTSVSGTPIGASVAAALASTYDVRATLRGPGITPDSAPCAWNATGKYFRCAIVTPRNVRTGRKNPYSITVTENLGGGFVRAPIDYYSQNPAPFYFG